MPKYESMGMTPSKHAPPLAVQLGSIKFWNQLKQNLESTGITAPRKRKLDEKYAENQHELKLDHS